MNAALVDRLVEAVLYEGHILYPYRPSSKKNRQRFTFGRIYPEAYAAAQNGAEPCAMQLQCLFRARAPEPRIEITVRFLQPLARDVGVLHEPLADWPENEEPPFEVVPVFELDGALYQTWDEASECDIHAIASPADSAGAVWLSQGPRREFEPLRDRAGRIVAVLARHQPPIAGTLDSVVEDLGNDLFRLTLRLTNGSEVPEDQLGEIDAVLQRTFASAHAVLTATGAEFVSLTDPPEDCATAATECRNAGVWPVLVGDEAAHECDTLLASPIILPDYPQVAAESAGSLFDSTEIDEILTLRILTMTDEEKREMRHADEHARRILERTEAMPAEHLLRMHGAMRAAYPVAEEIFRSNSRLDVAKARGVDVRAGDRVRLHPRGRADIMDIALAGRVAIIDAVEQDAEGKVHLAVVIEDDPGRDLGALRQPGHRFFYGLDEVEPLKGESEASP